jgi:hypothetical protein
MAICFFKHTSILEGPGLVEVPVDMIHEEVVKFWIPCILAIMDNQILLGGMSSNSIFLVTFC